MPISGSIESATKLKGILINKFYDLKFDYEDENYYSQGDDMEGDYRWREYDGPDDDYAFGAELQEESS